MALTTIDPALQNTQAQYTGFKNRIINGAMGIWQRGTIVTPTSGAFTYITDRFAGYPGTSSSVTYSQSSNAPTGFSYSFKAQRPVSNTNTATSYISQVIESNNMRDLVGQSATISFWALAGANYSSGGVAVYLNTGTVADQGIATSIGGWTGYATATSLIFTPTTTWTKYTATGTIPSNALEMAILFGYATTGTAGADDSFYITGVQLEKGSTATSFDYRPYGTELSLCQRYYYRIVSGVAGQIFGSSFNATTSTALVSTTLPVIMRASPSAIEQNGTAGDYRVNNLAVATTCTSVPAFNNATPYCAFTTFTTGAVLVAGQGSAGSCVNGNAYLAWSAEL